MDILSKIADFISAADSGVIHSIVQDMVRQTSLLLFAAVWMIYFVFRSMEQYVWLDDRKIDGAYTMRAEVSDIPYEAHCDNENTRDCNKII